MVAINVVSIMFLVFSNGLILKETPNELRIDAAKGDVGEEGNGEPPHQSELD